MFNVVDAINANVVAVFQNRCDIGHACCRSQRGEQIVVRLNTIGHRAGFNLRRPTNEHGNSISAFPSRSFLTPERRGTAIGPCEALRTVVRCEHHNGIFGQAQFVELFQYQAHMVVQLNHAAAIDVLFGRIWLCQVPRLGFQVRPHMHARAVVPQKEGLFGLGSRLDKFQRAIGHHIVNGLHAFDRQRAFVLRWLSCKSFNDAAWLVLGQCFGGIVALLRFFFCIQVVEVAKELIKPVVVRQVLIAIAQVAFAKMSGAVALGFQ